MLRRRIHLAILFLCALSLTSCRNTEDDGLDFASAFERQSIDNQWVASEKGNWGNLEFKRYFLPIPKAWLEHSSIREAPLWQITGISSDKVKQSVLDLPLNAEERKLWLETCKFNDTTNGTKVIPSKEFRWALQPQNRSALYLWLAQFPENNDVVFPFCYEAARYQEWLKGDDLSLEVRQTIAKLCYPAGNTICLADLDLIEEKIKSKEELSALLAILHRHPYCDVRIKLDKTTDIDSLAGYWGEWNRFNRVKRKLKEALGDKDVAYVSLPNILPPLTRSLLDTFPEIPKDADQPQRDCYWTAFNFFNRQPDDRFNDSKFMEKALVDYHDKVEGTPRYGDILFLVDGTGSPIHAAVYLADDFIYTKNGGHFTQPWVIMRLNDLKACYPQAVKLREAYYRWNPNKARKGTT